MQRVKRLLEGRGRLWLTSLIFAGVVLGGYAALEQRWFTGILLILGIGQVACVLEGHPRLSSSLFLSQSLVALASVTAITLHVWTSTSPSTPVGRTLFDFLKASLSDDRTYTLFLVYAMTWTAVVSVLFFWAWRQQQRQLEAAVVTFYVASSVNLAITFSLQRPLYRVSGDLHADAFFFAAGIFGLEFSLPLHLMILLVALAAWLMWHVRA